MYGPPFPKQIGRIMRAITITIIITFLAVLHSGRSLAANDPFDAVVTNLLSARPFKSPEIVSDLRAQAQRERVADDRLTARIALVLYLLDRDTTNRSEADLGEPFRICREIIQDNPETWQAELAKFYLVFEPGYTGDMERQLSRVEEAFSTVNFALLDKTTHRVLQATRRIYSRGTETGWREILLAIKASVLCEIDRLAEAEKVLQSLTNKKHRALIRSRVDLGKKMRARRKELQRQRRQEAQE